ncbi:MAG TPA: hypothetical protein VMM60_13280 [Ilumatobacter sp.]|nr:hypothetical protein [Ilumatobacter sp.]
MNGTARRTTVAIAAFAVVCAASVGSAAAQGDPPVDPPVDPPAVTVPPVTVPEPTTPEPTVPIDVAPIEVGVVDGVEVAVGLAPVPPVPAPSEVGLIDGVEVAVGVAPIPPTPPIPVVASAANVARTPASTAVARPAVQGLGAVTAATQLIDSMETISVLLDAWS